MKTTKKIFAVLIALVLTFSMAIPAIAAGSNKITVNNTTKDAKYNLYQMATLLTDGTAYAYSVTEDWKDFFKGFSNADEEGLTEDQKEDWSDVKNYFNYDKEKGTLTAVDGLESDSAAMEAFGKLAKAYAEKRNISSAVATSTADDLPVTFDNLSDGYYLVTSTVGTRAIVKSGSGDRAVEINEKNDRPNLIKEVEEDSKVEAGEENTFGEENDAQIGQKVNFKVTITAQQGAENYVMHDKMEKGLDFDPTSVEITVGGEKLVKYTNEETAYDYKVVTGTAVSENGKEDVENCTFEIVFAKAYLDTIKEPTDIVVTYSATLTGDALVDTNGVDGIQNDAKLTYGNEMSTEWDRTTTKLYEIDLLKYKGADLPEGVDPEDVDAEFLETHTLDPLKGAKFQLKDANDNILKLVKIDDNNYRLATAEDIDAEGVVIVTEFETTAIKHIYIKGLDSDTYYLKEIAAPEAYNILADPVKVEIATGNTTAKLVTVANFGGTELPSTGGIGTTIFYAVGGTLVVAAAVVLVVKRRMRGAEEA